MNVFISKVFSSEELESCMDIRKKVFIEGQNVPAEVEFDGLDSESEHYTLKVGESTSGTARVRYIQNKARVERVSILPEYQGKGLGKKLMEYIMNDIKALSEAEVVLLSAQTHAIGFYENLGFSAFGEEYMDTGIPCKDMQIMLSN